MANNIYGAEVNVISAEQKNGFIALRVVESEAKDNDQGYISRFMDVAIGDKSPMFMQNLAKTLTKGDRIYVEGTLRAKEGTTPGKTFESIQYVRRLAKLASNTNGQGSKPSGLDDF